MNTVLIVDDMRLVRIDIRRLLEGMGLEVAEAESCEGAVSYLKRNTPDLILLDLDIPGVSGVECCKKIKANYRSTDVMIIAMVPMDQIALQTEALINGCVACINRPIDIRELLATVRFWLKK